jgi:ankyrin repeat protein
MADIHLLQAAKDSHADQVFRRHLEEYGANVVVNVFFWRSELHDASFSSDNPDAVSLKLDKGTVLINKQDCHHGMTALHLACLYGRVFNASLLLDKGADPNIQDKNGKSTLHHACIHDHFSTASWLLDKGLVNAHSIA